MTKDDLILRTDVGRQVYWGEMDDNLDRLGYWSGIWAAGTYQAYEIVIHNGLLMTALRTTTEEPQIGATDWELMADSSPAAAGTFVGLIDTPPDYVGAAQNVLYVDSQESGVMFAPAEAIGGITHTEANWAYSNDTAMFDPGAGNFRLDALILTQVTECAIHDFDDAIQNQRPALLNVTPGNFLIITDPNDFGRRVIYRINGVTDNLTWFGFTLGFHSETRPVLVPASVYQLTFIASTNTFVHLDDTPDNYLGSADQVVMVNTQEDGLHFTNLPPTYPTFLSLTDSPTTYAGQRRRLVGVNDAEDGLLYEDPVQAPRGQPYNLIASTAVADPGPGNTNMDNADPALATRVMVAEYDAEGAVDPQLPYSGPGDELFYWDDLGNSYRWDIVGVQVFGTHPNLWYECAVSNFANFGTTIAVGPLRIHAVKNNAGVAQSFLQLIDTPASYAGREHHAVNVNAIGSGLVFGLTVQEAEWNTRRRYSLSGGGTKSVTNNRVKWTQDYIVIGYGESPTSTPGHSRMSCPTSGTIEGLFGTPNVTANSDGVPLTSWQTLYYIPSPTSSASNAANYRIFNYAAGNGATNPDERIPESYIQLIMRNGDENRYYFPNGVNLLNGESTTGYVGRNRTITAGSGLSGGGNLAADRTINNVGQATATVNVTTNGQINTFSYWNGTSATNAAIFQVVAGSGGNFQAMSFAVETWGGITSALKLIYSQVQGTKIFNQLNFQATSGGGYGYLLRGNTNINTVRMSIVVQTDLLANVSMSKFGQATTGSGGWGPSLSF